MPRARMIKPEYFASGKIADTSVLARLFFVGLWTQADDNGVLRDSPRDLKALVLPYDNVSREQVAGLINELAKAELLHRYTVDGVAYLQVHDWHDHQVVKHPSYRHPLPDGNTPKSPSSRGKNNTMRRDPRTANKGEPLPQSSPTPPGALREASPTPPGGVPTRRGEERRRGALATPSSSPSSSIVSSESERMPEAIAREEPITQTAETDLADLSSWQQVAASVKDALADHWPDSQLKIYAMDPGLVRQWLADGATPADLQLTIDIVCGERIAAGIEHGPPTTLKYFHKRVVERIEERRRQAGEQAGLTDGAVFYNGQTWPRDVWAKLWETRIRLVGTSSWDSAGVSELPEPRVRNAPVPPGVPVDVWARILEAYWRRVDINAGRRRA